MPYGRAVTPHDKREIIERLAVVWEKNPCLRLGQLLMNACDGPFLYNIEDYPLMKRVESVYDTHE